jgi:hypothetical protein
MRKLILIIAIALMSSSSCYANLSLASNAIAGGADNDDVPQTSIEQPKSRATPHAAIKHRTAVKRPTSSRPRLVVRSQSHGYYEPSHEHCF